MKLKKYKLCAAIYTVCSMHNNQFSCLGKSLQMIEYSCLWKSHTIFVFLPPNCNVCHYSLLNPMLIYHNFQKTIQKYYEICKFTVVAISKNSTENDKVIAAQLPKIIKQTT